jgi:hypothetical protein
MLIFPTFLRWNVFQRIFSSEVPTPLFSQPKGTTMPIPIPIGIKILHFSYKLPTIQKGPHYLAGSNLHVIIASVFVFLRSKHLFKSSPIFFLSSLLQFYSYLFPVLLFPFLCFSFLCSKQAPSWRLPPLSLALALSLSHRVAIGHRRSPAPPRGRPPCAGRRRIQWRACAPLPAHRLLARRCVGNVFL